MARARAVPHSWILVGVIAFVATADLLDVAPLRYDVSGSASLGTFFNIAAHWLVLVGFIWALITLSGMQDRFEPRVLVMWARDHAARAVAQPTRRAARRCVRWARCRAASRSAVIIGHNELGKVLGQQLLRDRFARASICSGYFDDCKSGEDRKSENGADAALLGDVSRLPQFILRNDVQLVYITWAMTREARIIELLETLRDSTVSIYFVPDVSVANLIQARVDFVNGIPVVGVCESPFYGVRGLAKRACDVAISAAAILLLSPVFIAVAHRRSPQRPGARSSSSSGATGSMARKSSSTSSAR